MIFTRVDIEDFVLRRNMSAVEDKQRLQAEIDAQKAEFFAKGGVIDRPAPVQLRCTVKTSRKCVGTERVWVNGHAPASTTWASNRNVARRYNQQYYNTGKPCVYGHLSPRYTSSGVCCSCAQVQRSRDAAARKAQKAA